MSLPLTTAFLLPGVTTEVALPSPNTTQALKVSNKSPYDIQYAGFGVLGADWIPSGTEYMLYAAIQTSGNLTLTAYNNANISPVTPGAVLITQYLFGESLPQGHWPVSIPFQSVNASSNVTTAQYLKDTVDPALTKVITIQASDIAGNNPTISADTSGNFSVSSDNGGVLTTLIQLIAGASPAVKLFASSLVTEILGTVKVDGNQIISSTGVAAVDFATANYTFRGTTAGGPFQFVGDGTNIDWFVSCMSDFTGTTTGTYNHGLKQNGASQPPTVVLPMCDVSGSQTMGYDTVTSTQVHITSFSGLGFHCFCMRR